MDTVLISSIKRSAVKIFETLDPAEVAAQKITPEDVAEKLAAAHEELGIKVVETDLNFVDNKGKPQAPYRARLPYPLKT